MLIDDLEGQRLNFPTNCAFGGPDLQDLYFANLEAIILARCTRNSGGIRSTINLNYFMSGGMYLYAAPEEGVILVGTHQTRLRLPSQLTSPDP